jgi:hypothetical protein
MGKINKTILGIAFSTLCATAVVAEEEESTGQWSAGDGSFSSEYCCEPECCSSWNWEASAGVVFGTARQRLGTPGLLKGAVSENSPFFLLKTSGAWDWAAGFSLKLKAQHCNQWGLGAGFMFIPLESSATTLFPANYEDEYCLVIPVQVPVFYKFSCYSPATVVSIIDAEADYWAADAYLCRGFYPCTGLELTGFAGMRAAEIPIKAKQVLTLKREDVNPIPLFNEDDVKYKIYGFRAALGAQQCFANGLSLRALLGATAGRAKVTEKNCLDSSILLFEQFTDEEDLDTKISSESHRDNIGMLGLDGELGGRFTGCCCNVPAYIDLSLFAHGWSSISDIRLGDKNSNKLPKMQEIIRYEDIVIWGFQASIGATF